MATFYEVQLGEETASKWHADDDLKGALKRIVHSITINIRSRPNEEFRIKGYIWRHVNLKDIHDHPLVNSTTPELRIQTWEATEWKVSKNLLLFLVETGYEKGNDWPMSQSFKTINEIFNAIKKFLRDSQ